MELTRELLLRIYKKIVTARLFDEKSITLYKQNKCHFQIGCKGHEVIGAVASEIFSPSVDWFFPYYREHSLVLGLGMSFEDFGRNLLSKETDPNSHGRQMPMHWGSKELNIISQSSPTGSQFLPAVGFALGLKKSKEKGVVYVSAGEGACCQGDFFEALNWASKDNLPIVFVIHNNLWAISVSFQELWCKKKISSIAEAFLPSVTVEGKDIKKLYEAFTSAYQRVKLGETPILIEALVPRLCSHSISDDQTKYRPLEDISIAEKKDPLIFVEAEAIELGCTKEELEKISSEIKALIDEAISKVEAEQDPLVEEIFVGAINYDDSFGQDESEPEGPEVVMVDSINQCLKDAMKLRSEIVVFGEDVAHGKGGVFGATRGLTELFGVERCFNSPLAESSIVGVAIGLALKGFKPVIEIQFGDYIWPAMNQIRNELNTISYRSKGDFTANVVIRVAVGGYIRGAFYHSQNIEATFSHFGGLVIVMPSNAGDAYGLLNASIRSNNPVLFLEHKGLYRAPYSKSPIKKYVPLGKAKIVSSGENLTIISYGYTLHRCVNVARDIQRNFGKTVEVIDIRTLYPLDFETIAKSIKKTSRALIVHEDSLFMGYGAEIAARIAQDCFNFLDAPVVRVGGLNVPGVCQAPNLEKAILPQEEQIYKSAVEVLNF